MNTGDSPRYENGKGYPPSALAFIEMHGFSDDWQGLGYSDDDLAALQNQIVTSPASNPVMPGTGGL